MWGSSVSTFSVSYDIAQLPQYRIRILSRRIWPVRILQMQTVLYHQQNINRDIWRKMFQNLLLWARTFIKSFWKWSVAFESVFPFPGIHPKEKNLNVHKTYCENISEMVVSLKRNTAFIMAKQPRELIFKNQTKYLSPALIFSTLQLNFLKYSVKRLLQDPSTWYIYIQRHT